MLGLLLLCCTFLVLRITSSEDIDWEAFTNGGLGQYPQAEFHSTKAISAPLIRVGKFGKACDRSDGYVFLSPSEPRAGGTKMMMFDHDGQLVWYRKELGAVKCLQVQKYKGSNYLTYWVGDDSYPGHGHGYYKMLDQTYSLEFTASALNGLAGDFHEFTITRDNTALLTAYEKISWNLTTLGRESGYIWDCIFQEIDIQNDLLLYQWRASDHFTFADMSVSSWEEYVGTDQHPWDWFHLNSVEKDVWGNFLIAARYTNAVSYIDRSTGKPLWHLGGSRNSFHDLTGGNATAFIDPHMARWGDAYTSITLFDNADFGLKQSTGVSKSHGVKVYIDRNRRKVIATTDFSHPAAFFAMSEGSMHKLDSGNYFIGFGSTAAYSEFARDGTIMCDAHYAPTVNATPSTGAVDSFVQSYRVYKQKWAGYPSQPPNIHIDQDQLFISWNGATEVRAWKVEAQAVDIHGTGKLTLIGVFPKSGFETAIKLKREIQHSLYRLVALDRHGHVIRSWYTDPGGNLLASQPL